MPAERYFHFTDFTKQNSIHLEGQEFHHLIHVMRGCVNDQVEIINGEGQLAIATIKSIEKKVAFLKITDVFTEKPSPTQIVLAQAIPRINRLETILEKGTELGTSEIWLFPGVHSEKKIFSETQLERFQTILIAATKQCGRLFLPCLRILPQLVKWKEWPPLPAFFGDVRPETPPLYKVWQEIPPFCLQKATLFIGPESGFSQEEVGLFEEHQVRGISLHSNILRTDTAAIAALSILSQLVATKSKGVGENLPA